jgi:hypothetical protein
MNQMIESKNKAPFLKAFDRLFNKREYADAERYWSRHYVQHSAYIAPSREGLLNLIKSIPPTLNYEPGTIVAEGRPRDRAQTIFAFRPARQLDCS